MSDIQRAIQLIANAQIEAAIEEGKFDNLPGLGKPFEFDDSHYDPHWWARRKAAHEKMKNLFAETPNRPVSNDGSES